MCSLSHRDSDPPPGQPQPPAPPHRYTPEPQSILVLRGVILVSGLDAVMTVAEALPVALVPEENTVSSVRLDVIHIGRLDVASLLHALHTQRMCLKVSLAGSVPCRAVASAACGSCLLRVEGSVLAKHVPADKDGVRIAELDEMKYRELLWCHTPLTDFWGLGGGTAARVAALNCYTMGDIARLSTINEVLLYKALGVKAEIVIDHAWGWEPTEIATIKSYRPSTNSLSSGQVLKEPYTAELARLIVREMTELLVLDMVRKYVVTKKLTLTIGYDRTSVQLVRRGRTPKEDEYKVTSTGKRYNGVVHKDHYGRPVPKHAHGTGNLESWTSSTAAIAECMMQLYDRIIDPDLMVRRINICACNLIYENNIPEDDAPVQLELFVDYEEVERRKAEKKRKEERERALQRATLQLQGRFGKNAVLRGMNLVEGGTTIERNDQIGGHRAEASEVRKTVGASKSYMKLAMDKIKDISGDLVDDIEYGLWHE